MIKFGCPAHFDHLYADDVSFAKTNGFSLLQIWYDKDGLSLKNDPNPVETILRQGFPTIIHAVLEIGDFEEHILKLSVILKQLRHTELIIHPVCKSEKIEPSTIRKLSDKVAFACKIVRGLGITVFIENNSKLDPIFSTSDEIAYLFEHNPEAEFLLDIAHIDDYMHLKRMLAVKMPKILHIADRHLELVHEHLPIGQGNIDFTRIFRDILADFSGRMILEITQSNDDLLASKKLLECYLRTKQEIT